MKFLALADLHYHRAVWKDGYFQSLLKEFIENNQIDCVLIAGDVVESSFIKNDNPYRVLLRMIIHIELLERIFFQILIFLLFFVLAIMNLLIILLKRFLIE